MGEFGGHGWPVQGHLWDNSPRNWGYGGLPQSIDEYKDRYRESIRLLRELEEQGISGGVYTQTTDVEGEINGLLTYDRKVQKIPAKELRKINEVLFQPLPATAGDKTSQVSPRPELTAPNREAIAAGLQSHDRALFIKTGWIRDPYIILAPDGYYYLTGTTPNPGERREQSDPYNTGLGPESIVGYHMQLWRSRDLIDWESLGTPFSLLDGYWAQVQPRAFTGYDRSEWHLWAPEVHFFNGRWHIVQTTPAPVRGGSNFAVTRGDAIDRPYDFPLGDLSKNRHDPSLFQDDDGTVWLLWANTLIAPLAQDLSGFTAQPVRIDPAGTRPGPDGQPISRIGHEGATMRKIGDKYVHFGTAWSTDRGRRGSYNLYYCTADEITGPYGPRRFAGRFLGHGTPFQDRDGQWWCTAFFNGNQPPLPREGIAQRDLAGDAQTINPQGVTIVPLDVRQTADGDVEVRAKDPAYAHPGPDEVQQF